MKTFPKLLSFIFMISTASQANVLTTTSRLYEKYGQENYMLGESITQESHVLQAAFLAYKSGAPDDVVIAALLHDVGQISSAEHRGHVKKLHEKHDDIGANWVKARGLPVFVADFLRYHTIVKVLLCENDPEYYAGLTQASKDSYWIQKEKFESSYYHQNANYVRNHPRLEDLKALRLIDDLAKLTDVSSADLPGFAFYQEIFDRAMNGNTHNTNKHWGQTIKSWRKIGQIDSKVLAKHILHLAFREIK